MHEFHLSVEQLDLIHRTFSPDDTFTRVLSRWSADADQRPVIRLSRDEAEQVRAKLTQHLAQVGFDKDYALTPQGELLEELIDQFALPSPD